MLVTITLAFLSSIEILLHSSLTSPKPLYYACPYPFTLYFFFGMLDMIFSFAPIPSTFHFHRTFLYTNSSLFHSYTHMVHICSTNIIVGIIKFRYTSSLRDSSRNELFCWPSLSPKKKPILCFITIKIGV